MILIWKIDCLRKINIELAALLQGNKKRMLIRKALSHIIDIINSMFIHADIYQCIVKDVYVKLAFIYMYVVITCTFYHCKLCQVLFCQSRKGHGQHPNLKMDMDGSRACNSFQLIILYYEKYIFQSSCFIDVYIDYKCLFIISSRKSCIHPSFPFVQTDCKWTLSYIQ